MLTFSPEATDADIVNLLGDNDERAMEVLSKICEEYNADFRRIAFDLCDMLISGERLYYAWSQYCAHDSEEFITRIAARDKGIVVGLNTMFPGLPPVREHGEQKTFAPVDGAVRDILKKAEEEGKLKRIDDGAEVIHGFFETMLLEMQASAKFVSNFRLNLGVGQGWAVFAISLVEILDRDGNPFKAQPTDEIKAQLEIQQKEPGETHHGS